MPQKTEPKGVREIAALPVTAKGEARAGLEHVQEYLARFGYLDRDVAKTNENDEYTSYALETFQKKHGLPVTGNLDEPTKKEMTKARCGLPDMLNAIDFATTCRWTKRNLTFAFDTGTADTAGEFTAVRNAFKTWAAIVPLTFTEVATNQAPDLFVDWRPANDPDHSMVGTVLAHADFPPGCSVITNTLPKPLHFDDSEHMWTIGAVANAFDIETVALHEIGHLLGLAHSNVAGSVMFPTVSDNFTKRSLTADDISGIKSLYPHQDNWRWCHKCQGMFFNGHATKGSCPTGGAHESTGSGNYSPAHNLGTSAGWQADWRWCSKCEGMFFGGHATKGVCPKDHAQHTLAGSGNYSHMHNFNVAPGQQRGWRWCQKCEGMWFGDNVSQGSCPASGTHSKVGSGNYSVVHR